MPTPLRYALALWSLCILIAGVSVVVQFSARITPGLEPGDLLLLLLAAGVFAGTGAVALRAARGGCCARAALDIVTGVVLLPIAAVVVLAAAGRVSLSDSELVGLSGIVLPLTAQVLMRLPSVRPAYRGGKADPRAAR
ncbi:hypothetical protein [Kitasatospora sp. NPDC059327]|uniref:hypothetical protein n=1 Tax=Kitasatospora sp. NPDC059327 TaxID=3346803 RepID=UPI00369C2F1A